MSGFTFQGIRKAPNGDFAPSFPMSESAYHRIRERWSALQLTDGNGESILGQQRETVLEEIVLDDALWQFWLYSDLKEDGGESSWQTMPIGEKVWLLLLCVRDGRWWREWAAENVGFDSWPWQKRLAFERTAVRESINVESTTPASLVPDHTRQMVVENMVKWHEDFDLRNRNLSPHDVPESYVGLVFDTI